MWGTDERHGGCIVGLGVGQIRPNGEQLIDDEGLVWSLADLRASFRRTRAIAGDFVVAIDGTGTQVVLQKADHALRIVDLSGTAPDTPIETLTQVDVAEARFSPNGDKLYLRTHAGVELIAVAAGTSVLVYDAAGKQVAWLKDHRCNVTEMRFLSGTDLMTTSSDQPATVWHLPSGELASKIRTFAFGSLIDICWEPAHAQILPEQGRVASFTHTAGITDWVPFMKDEGAMAQAAESLVARCLNTAERAEFFLDPESPHWCITDLGRSDDPAQWRPYWPYSSPEWSEWLKARKSGESPPLPIDDSYLAEIPVAAS